MFAALLTATHKNQGAEGRRECKREPAQVGEQNRAT